MLALLLLFCICLTNSEPLQTVDLFFSGGGIRATYGTLIAMCKLRTYWNSNPIFSVDNIAGLSGGAWGVSLLGLTNATDPCELVERVQQLPNWGKVESFRSIKCGQWDTPGRLSCFNGWSQDIARWFDELLLGNDQRPSLKKPVEADSRSMQVPKDFSQHGHGEVYETMVWIQTDPCHFEGSGKKARGDGACMVEANSQKMYCTENAHEVDGKAVEDEKVFETHVGSCNIENVRDVRRALTIHDVIAYSSAAWASASAVSKAAGAAVSMGLVKSKPSPVTTCQGEDEEENHDLQASFCDAGAECNLPLGAINVMYHASTFSINKMNQFVAFDYSDNGGNQDKAVAQCLKKWTAKKGMKVTKAVDQPWGYTMLVTGVYPANEKFILHVVLFRGVNKRDKLVKEFSTVKWNLDPNYFEPKSARKVASEYAEFLQRDLFDQVQNPFTLTAGEWEVKVNQLPVTTHAIVPPEPRLQQKPRRQLPLQPEQ